MPSCLPAFIWTVNLAPCREIKEIRTTMCRFSCAGGGCCCCCCCCCAGAATAGADCVYVKGGATCTRRSRSFSLSRSLLSRSFSFSRSDTNSYSSSRSAPAHVFPAVMPPLASRIIPLVVGASGAVGLRRCLATSRPDAMGDRRPPRAAGDVRPFPPGGDVRPFPPGGVMRPFPPGGDGRTCRREAVSTTVGEPSAVPERRVSESRRL